MRQLGARLALVAVLGGVLPACAAPEPREVVADAFDRTLADELSYRLTASADREALAALADDAGSVAAALNGFTLLGHRTAAGSQLSLQVLGGVAVLELVTLADGSVYLRTDAAGLVGDQLDGLLSDLRTSGASDDVVQGIRALFARQWVGIEGEAGLDGLLDDIVPRPTGSATEADGTGGLDLDLVADLAAAAATVGEPEDVPGGQRFTIAFDADEVGVGLDAADDAVGDVPLVGSLLAGLTAGAADGDVVVADGVVTSIVLRLQAGAADAGRLELRLDLDDHGDAPSVSPPEGATVVRAEDLAAALVALLTPVTTG